MKEEKLSIKSMDEKQSAEQIVNIVINEVRESQEMKDWRELDINKEIEIKMYRNIDIKEGGPFKVWIKNNRNDVKKEVDHVKILEEKQNGKITTLRKALLECNFQREFFISSILNIMVDIVKNEIYENQHERIGWDKIAGVKSFKLYDIINADSIVASSYIGDLKIKKKGSYEDYIKGIKKLIIGNTYLELAWCISVAGVISSILEIDDTNLVINYYGESGSGKTITSKIMLSMWSLSAKLFMSFNSTDDEIERKSGQYKILPVVIDDKLVSISGEVNEKRSANKLAEQLFRLSEGHVKGRINSKDSHLEYYCPVIMTSETSIVEAMAQTKTFGQYHRLIEIQCKRGQLTKDDNHANQIDAFLEGIGGVAGEKFVQSFLRQYDTKEKISTKYYSIREDVKIVLKDRSIPVRAANRIAMILLSVKLVDECFQVDINSNKIQELLLNSVERMYTKAQSLDKHYENFVDYCNKHSDYFVANRKEGEITKHFGHIKKDEIGRKIVQLQGQAINFILTGNEPEEYFKWIQEEIDGIKRDNEKEKPEKNEGGKTITTNIYNIISKWDDLGYLRNNLPKSSKGARTTKITLFTKAKPKLVYTIYMDCVEDK